MIARGDPIEELVARLEEALDEEIELLKLRDSQTRSLSAAILDRQDDAMESLLAQIEGAQDLQERTDQRMSAARNRLAEAIGAGPERLRLAELIAMVPDELAPGLQERRRRVVELTKQLRRSHARATMLLKECARINRMLLEGLLGGGSGSDLVTYGAGGKDRWQSLSAIVDTRR